MSTVKVRYKDGSSNEACEARQSEGSGNWQVYEKGGLTCVTMSNASFADTYEFVGVGGGSIPIGPASEQDMPAAEKTERERLLWEIQTAVQDNYEHKLTMDHLRRIAAVVKGEDTPRVTHVPAATKLKRLPNGCWINPKTVVRVLTPEDAAVIVFDSGEFIECVGLHPDAVVAALNAD